MVYDKGIFGGIPWLDHTPGIDSLRILPPEKKIPFPVSRGTPVFLQESIQALLRTLTARDPYTGHHSARVTDLSLHFARFLGLSSQDLESLKIAGYLHDIGKIGVRDTILLKPGPLTPEERAIIETHPIIGHKIVEPLGLLAQENQIILHHHEAWNGCGYPHGLAQDKIPFLCRVLALADVFDALTSDRPYRPRFSLPDALAEIETQAGRQFDPDLTEKFVHMITSRTPHIFA